MVSQESSRSNPPSSRRKYVPVVGVTLRKVLVVILALFALIMVNSVYLVSIRILGLSTGESHENWFFLNMFIAHLVLGLAIVVPIILFGFFHIRNAWNRPNRRAVRAGYALLTTAVILLVTGILLMRIDGLIVIKDQSVRALLWWVHVVAPILVMWLFVLHRLAGRRIRWKVGLGWGAVAAVFAVVMVVLQSQDPRQWNVAGNPDGDQYFFPSLSRTVTGDFISEQVLDNDEYCLECHADIHDSWMHSVHKFSSFNNPAYLASVKETREFSMERDGNVNASRFCAGCHDPVPFFSGAFNDPDFDMEHASAAHAGITCTVCHSITHVNSVRGNADYTIEEPVHYPFAFSDNTALQWLNQQLVKAKPEFHRKTFLKPLHKEPEFCGTCHKVHLPEELNGYKWLRGQNHYDAFQLSGVSGQGISSFYYPPQAEVNCNECHMPLVPSTDFGAQVRGDDSQATVHDHMFPSANTAIPTMVEMPRPLEAIAKHQEFLEGVMRVDLFGLKEGGGIEGELHAPLRPTVPELKPGETYLLEAIIRTVKMGHIFTQGTSDSNEVWMDVEVISGDRVLGRSGGYIDEHNEVDPWSHFVNSFVIDRDGNRIDRRNAQDIFTPLYNHQIPPGAADAVHYSFTVPEDVTEPVTVTVSLKYRKFDTQFMRFVEDDPEYVNDLPVTTLAEDSITFPIVGGAAVDNPDSLVPQWQRWNDYGIGLLRKGPRGELRGAEEAFLQVEALGRSEGPINLARVYLKEGRVTEDAPAALARASASEHPARQWHLLWFGGMVDKQNGNLDAAIDKFRQVTEGGFAQAKGRGFDFSKDYNFLNEFGSALYQRARQERGASRQPQREAMLREAATVFQNVLTLDPENTTAHYNLQQIHLELGEDERARHHAELHGTYKVDDNARDRAVSEARRRYPAANHAAEDVVIYDLQRPGAPGVDESSGDDPAKNP